MNKLYFLNILNNKDITNDFEFTELPVILKETIIYSKYNEIWEIEYVVYYKDKIIVFLSQDNSIGAKKLFEEHKKIFKNLK